MNRRSTIRILLVCAALESVAACKVLPHPDRPAPGVAAPEEWAAAGGRAPEAVSSAPWWRGFEDEALGAAIDEALVANRDLAASAARIVQALAQARIAGAERLPTLGLGADASRSGQILLGFPTPDGEPLSFVTNSFGVSLDLAWEVDLWGRIAAQSAAAEADFAATFETHEAARQSLAAQVAKAWFAWQEARLQGDLARRSEQTFTRTLELTRSRFESGLTSALDVRLAASNLAGAQALREQRGDAAQRAGRQLETLLGRYPSGDLAASTGLPAMPDVPAVGAPADLLARRPDLRAAEDLLRAADERLYAARAELYPRLNLLASGGTVSDEVRDVVDPDFKIWSLAAGLVQPIFQGGRLRAGVDLADARVREALANFEGALLRAFSEVESALEADGRLARQEAFERASSEEAAAASRIAEERYASGLVDFLEVLEAQRRELESESRYLSVQRLRLENRVDLHLALGGGFEVPESQP